MLLTLLSDIMTQLLGVSVQFNLLVFFRGGNDRGYGMKGASLLVTQESFFASLSTLYRYEFLV